MRKNVDRETIGVVHASVAREHEQTGAMFFERTSEQKALIPKEAV